MTLYVAVAVGAFAGIAYPKTYSATATLRLIPTDSVTTDRVTADDLAYLDRLTNTYASMATSGVFRDGIRRTLGLPSRPTVAVTGQATSELIHVTATASKAKLAETVANYVALQLVNRVQFDGVPRAGAFVAQQIGQLRTELATYQTSLDALGPNPSTSTDRIRRQVLLDDIAAAQPVLVTLLTQFEQQQLTDRIRASTLSTVSPATLPTQPTGPSILLTTTVAGVLGLLLGSALAFLRERRSTEVQTSVRITDTARQPILAEIPTAKNLTGPPLFSTGSAEDEAVRRLRTSILASFRTASAPALDESVRGLRTGTLARFRTASAPRLFVAPVPALLVTSAASGDGKSTVAANLARSMAGPERTVVLIDADLRKPSLHAFFDRLNTSGLSNILLDGFPIDGCLLSTQVPGLKLLPAGPPVPDPTGTLGGQRMDDLLRDLRMRADIVIADSAALRPVADAASLAPHFDGVLLVVRHGQTREEDLVAARENLEQVGATMIGVVVNRVPQHRLRKAYTNV